MDWSDFDSKIDEKMIGDIQTLENGGSIQGDHQEIPVGKYEVVPEKMEMKLSNNNNPMVVVWFRIVAGPFTKQMIFANLVLNSSFGIHKAKQFLKKMDEEADVKFESFSQFEVLIAGMSEELCTEVSYVLDYADSKNINKATNKPYKEVNIEDGPFEVPKTYEAPEEW